MLSYNPVSLYIIWRRLGVFLRFDEVDRLRVCFLVEAERWRFDEFLGLK